MGKFRQILTELPALHIGIIVLRFYSCYDLIGGGGYDITYTPGVPIPFKTTPFYDILISCQDLNNIIKSNFVVDIVKNQPPSISNLPGIYLFRHF